MPIPASALRRTIRPVRRARREIDKDQRLWPIVHAAHGQAGLRGGDRLGHARLGRGERRIVGAVANAKRQFGAAFRRNAQLLAHGVIELEAKRDRLARLLGRNLQRKDHAVFVAERLPASSVNRCGAG